MWIINWKYEIIIYFYCIVLGYSIFKRSFGVPWVQIIAICNSLKLGHFFVRLHSCCAVLGKVVYILRCTDVFYVTLYILFCNWIRRIALTAIYLECNCISYNKNINLCTKLQFLYNIFNFKYVVVYTSNQLKCWKVCFKLLHNINVVLQVTWFVNSAVLFWKLLLAL